MDWKTIEMLGYTYYSNKGYTILVSLVTNYGYDFVAEKNGKFIRVNAKKACLRDKKKKNSWSVSQEKNKYKNPVDTFLVWLPHLEKFIELPNDFFNNHESKIRRIPKEYIQ